MTQKQILGATLGVLVMGVLGYFVYQQFSMKPQMGTVQQNGMMNSQTAKKEVVPEKIDDIADVIASESSMDLSALDEEESGETADLNEDSESINNLGTSYDENSF